MKEILETFKNIPADIILKTAIDFQAKIVNDITLIQKKSAFDYVTEADFEIQNLILNYFSNSKLVGTYNIQAEENLDDRYKKLNDTQKDYLLIIDPLDGTNPFCRGEQTWGTMVGLFCKKTNKLIFSWNLISTGEIYTSEASKKLEISNKNPIKCFDVFDYGSESANLFPQKLEEVSLGKYKRHEIRATSCPSAVWVGYELYKRNLNGVLWLPERGTKKGKGHYPNYDLVFIGAIKAQGWEVALGKKDGLTQILAIADNKEDLEFLKQVSHSLVSSDFKVEFETEFTV